MPLEGIIKEKTSADHLLYVSLKYTKTCDVMLNLAERWKSMIGLCLDVLLQKAKKQKVIKSIPAAPKMRIELLKEAYKKEPVILEVIDLYEFFKKLPDLEKIRENEFRKNVCLRIIKPNGEVRIDMDKLKEYSELLERFIKLVREYI